MKHFFFKTLAAFNKVVLPRYSKKDITRLSAIDKAIVGFRYWVTKNSLN